MRVTWLSAFLDTPAADAPAAEEFWVAVTGWPLSSRRGAHQEFATLEPPDGDAVLRVQVVGAPPPGGMHLEVHTADVMALSKAARDRGAEQLTDGDDGFVVHRSPGGLTFCVVPHGGSERPAPVSWGARRSIVDQVCLDIAEPSFEAEAGFWADLLHWPRQHGGRPEFDRLLPPPGQPLQILLQRLDESDGPARMHLDLAADDVADEVGRHLDLGAQGCASSGTGPPWPTRRGAATA